MPTIRRLTFSGAPRQLEAVVAEGADASRRGLSALELDRLLEQLLPGRTIVRGERGQPVVRGSGLHLSLSHAPGATALALAPFPVGIDIECLEADLDVLAIDADLLGARDHGFLRCQDEDCRREQFYRLWTLKEARLKRFGHNLAGDRLPEILKDAEATASFTLEGRVGADMSTAWLAQAGRRYCLGVCWGA